MSSNNLEQSNLELVELNEDELDVVAGGRGRHKPHHKPHQPGTKTNAFSNAGTAVDIATNIYGATQK